MGEQNAVSGADEGEKLREFMQALLQDLRALERMIETGMIEEASAGSAPSRTCSSWTGTGDPRPPRSSCSTG